jgi:hypothetical protein
MTRRKAGENALVAARIQAEAGSTTPTPLAERYEGKARERLDPSSVTIGAGGELVPGDDFASNTLPAILDTLANPDHVAADASRDRLDLADRAGTLEIALDTADSIGTTDSLERMLAHQLAAVHVGAMKLAGLMNDQATHAARTQGQERQAACIEAARLAGGVARLSGSFQAGMATLQRMRSGGKQIVVVQHAHHYAAGAQTVVAPVVAPGGRGRRRSKTAGG